MELKMTYQRWIIMIHALFWLMLLMLLVLIFNAILNDIVIAIGATLINIVGFSILVYGNLLWLLPKYFSQKKYWLYGFGVFVLLLVTSMLRFWLGYGLSKSMNWGVVQEFTPSFFGSMLISGSFFLLISIPLYLINNWFKKQELEHELKTHQLEAELRFLKAQVNPHFLFNALNNIYSLSFEQSTKTPKMILKLSEMMSYMLYDCNNEQVNLSKEIDYLRNYIDLQQLKKDGEFNIKFEAEAEVKSVMIYPMLFIPFFENAFKHGNLENTKNGWFKSKFVVNKNILIFHASNSIGKVPTSYKKGGIGLQNIQERLALLYPKKHDFKISHTNYIFTIDLTIDLNQ
jgi:two-component system LytT family sensor kinase